MTVGVIVIAGATATGKSSLALALAERLETCILSADSRQVYRGLDIGTAKPTLGDRQRIPHRLIDICEPTVTLTLAEYQQQAQASISEAHQAGKTPLLVGGTGLYLQAITQDLQIPRVAPQPDLRSQLAAQGQPQMYAWLQQVDAGSATRIHAHDQVRTLRALEVYYVTGIPLSQQQGRRSPAYPILQIGLDCPDLERLAQRIQQRTGQMLENGWLAEIEQLGRIYGWELPLLQTLGYAEMNLHLAGNLSLEAAIQLTVLHTRQFAKRQRTWFRAVPEMQWFDADQPRLLEQVWIRVEQFLNPC
jgi:tRNA dimethylallyltransferase